MRGAALVSSIVLQGALGNCACKFLCGVWRWEGRPEKMQGHVTIRYVFQTRLCRGCVNNNKNTQGSRFATGERERGSFPRDKELVKTFTTKPYNKSIIFCCYAFSPERYDPHIGLFSKPFKAYQTAPCALSGWRTHQIYKSRCMLSVKST